MMIDAPDKLRALSGNKMVKTRGRERARFYAERRRQASWLLTKKTTAKANCQPKSCQCTVRDPL